MKGAWTCRGETRDDDPPTVAPPDGGRETNRIPHERAVVVRARATVQGTGRARLDDVTYAVAARRCAPTHAEIRDVFRLAAAKCRLTAVCHAHPIHVFEGVDARQASDGAEFGASDPVGEDCFALASARGAHFVAGFSQCGTARLGSVSRSVVQRGQGVAQRCVTGLGVGNGTSVCAGIGRTRTAVCRDVVAARYGCEHTGESSPKTCGVRRGHQPCSTDFEDSSMARIAQRPIPSCDPSAPTPCEHAQITVRDLLLPNAASGWIHRAGVLGHDRACA